ncbi:MAG TPA: beta-ketoacyl-ACP synthase II [Thermodesulfovibrionales bacterium]|nr:beta-ketoacyl-ACP synthase II [Thermodesulfovibrionales bacterium]
MKRVVVTGIGVVSPIGNTFHDAYQSANAGSSGIRQVTRFDIPNLPWKVAGELKHFDPGRYLSVKEIRRLDPFVQYAVAASVMAVQDAVPGQKVCAGRKEQGSRRKVSPLSELLIGSGIIIGSSRGGISTLDEAIRASHSAPEKRHSVSPYLMPATTISMAPSYVAQILGIKGHCLGVSNACASGAVAIGEAFRLIRRGYRYPVLCGGAEAPVCRICFEGYGSSGALSRTSDSTASRPFDRTRDGFVLSEGACVMVLEERASARRRGARIYGEIVGYANTCDAFHQTAPSADGEAESIRAAAEDAGLDIWDIGFINAHGTSTRIGDKTEADAIKRVFGRRADRIPVSSLKSITGHMLAASGALEAAVTMVSMREGILPPTMNLSERDGECDLDIVTEARKTDVEFAISNSFGFGGVNAVLVFKRG